MKPFLVFLLLFTFTRVLYGQELFITHAHQHYIERDYSSFRNNPFSNSLRKINNYFCRNNFQTYWVFDKDFWPKRDYPVKRCGAKKLQSKWGNIDSYQFDLSENIVLTGIYFGNCVSTTYRSVAKRFSQNKNQVINVHIPLTATIGYYGKDYSNVMIKKIIQHKHFQQQHLIKNYQENSFDIQIYVNNELSLDYQSPKTVDNKILKMYLWSNEDQLLDNFLK